MIPFEEIAHDTLANVRGVASDLDDTLTFHAALTEASLSALFALSRAGVPCVVVTGRPLGWAEVLAGMLPVRAIVAENGGAWVARENGTRVVHYVDPAHVREDGMARVRACASELTQRFPALRPVRELAARHTDFTLDVGEFTRVPADVVADAEAFVRAQGLHAATSSIHMHLSYRAPDKFAGLCAAVAHAGMEPERVADQWLFVGDSPNDASAFRAITHAVGVAEVRKYEGRMAHWPRYVTRAGEGHGFAEVVARLLAAQTR